MYKTTTLVFLKTTQDVKQFTEIFQSIGYKAIGFNAQQDQGQRLNTMQQLKSDQDGTIIFATDIASRGLDISSIKLVIQFSCPQNVASFIHRAGRCCRQEGQEDKIIGINFCLIGPEDAQKYQLVNKVCFSQDKKPIEFSNINYNIYQRLQAITSDANVFVIAQHELQQDLDKLHRLQVDSIEEFLHIINDKKLRKENKLYKFYKDRDGEIDEDDIEMMINKEKQQVLYSAQQLRTQTFTEGRLIQKMKGSEQNLSIIQLNRRELTPLNISDNMKNLRWQLTSIVVQSQNKKQKKQKKEQKQEEEQQPQKQNPFKQQFQVIKGENIVDLNNLLSDQQQLTDYTEKKEKKLRNVQNKMNKYYQEQILQKQNEIKQSGMQQDQYQKLIKELKKDYDFEYDNYGRKEFHVKNK